MTPMTLHNNLILFLKLKIRIILTVMMKSLNEKIILLTQIESIQPYLALLKIVTKKKLLLNIASVAK